MYPPLFISPSLTFVPPWAPQVRDKLAPQKFTEEIPWPPILVLKGTTLSSQSAIDERFRAYEPTLKRAQYLPEFTGLVVLGFSGMGGDHWAKYKQAKRLHESLQKERQKDINGAHWLTRDELRNWRGHTWAKKVIEWCEKNSITWVNKDEKEKEMLREEARREKEVRRCSDLSRSMRRAENPTSPSRRRRKARRRRSSRRSRSWRRRSWRRSGSRR